MDYLNNILSAQNQPVQLVEEAIPTLCNRLQHATMASDRRSAVLGLKSFSRQYREAVVENGVRALVLTLSRDAEAPAIVRAVLETFLILFIRGEGDDDLTRGWFSHQSRTQNGRYPSPLLMEAVKPDELSLWIADELTQNETSVQMLVQTIADNENDFHIRLYAVQLLEALVLTRPARTKECLLNTPTAVSTVVSLLHDVHDQVRNEAILLLMAVANDNFHVQKLVAFENTFDRLFDIIDEEGGVRGSIVVQDCLTLITNLLQYNASNQKFFLEAQCVPRLALLLGEPVDVAEDPEGPENGLPQPPMVWTPQRLQNMFIALEICRILVSEDSEFLAENQQKLFQAGVLFTVLKLVFSPVTANQVRLVALMATGDLIVGNSALQLQFSQIDVPYMDPSMPTQLQAFDRPAPVTIALLNWALYVNSVHAFDIRMAAAYCLHAYFRDNNDCKAAFLNDQIRAYADPSYFTKEITENGVNGHEKGLSPTPFANIFSTLMDYDAEIKLNPYRLWFAVVILLYLFEENTENRALSRTILTGDADAGEEVLGSIQAISGLLVTTLESANPRPAIGYLMLLTVWLYENFDAVNDFLGDASILKAILAFLSNSASDVTFLVHGMATILLGVVYEFSSKDSPLPRVELHSLLTKALGKDNYSLKVRQFKDNEAFKNFDPSTISAAKDDTGLPDVYFDPLYVSLVKENFGRIRKALYHDPNIEPQGHISYDVYEELENAHSALKKDLAEKQQSVLETEKKLTEHMEAHLKEHANLSAQVEASCQELDTLKEAHSSLKEDHSALSSQLKEMENSKNRFEQDSSKYYKELQEALKKAGSTSDASKALELKLEESEKARKKAEDGINKMSRELFQLTKKSKDSEAIIAKLEKQIGSLKAEMTKSSGDFQQKFKKLDDANGAFKAKIDQLNAQINDSLLREKASEKLLREAHEKVQDIEATNEHLMDKLRSAASAFLELKELQNKFSEESSVLKGEKEVQSRRIFELESEISVLSTAKDASDKQLSELQTSSESQTKELREMLSNLRTSKDDLVSQCTQLKEEIKLLKASLEEANLKYEGIKTESGAKYAGLEELNQALTKRLEESEAEKGTVVKNHEIGQKELSELKSEHSKAKELHETSLAEKSKDHAAVVAEIEKHKADLVALKEAHLKEIEDLSGKHSSATKDLEKQASSISEMRERSLGTEKELKALEEKSALLERELLMLNTKNAELEKSLKISQTASTENDSKFQEEKTKLESQIFDLQKSVSEKTESHNALQKSHHDLQESKKELQKAHDDHKRSNLELEDDKNSLEKQLQELERKTKSDVANLQKARDDLKEKLEISKTAGTKERLQLEEKLAKLDSELKGSTENLSSEKAALSDKLGAIESEFSKHKETSLSEKEALVIKMTQLKDALTELEKAHTSAKNEHETSSNEHIRAIEENKAKIAGLSSDLSSEKSNAKKLREEKVLLEDALESLKSNISEKEAEIKKATETNESLSSKLRVTENLLAALKIKMEKSAASYEQQMHAKEDQIKALEREVEEKTKDFEKERTMFGENSETVVQEYTAKIQKLEENMAISKEKHGSEISGLQNRNAELDKDIDNLTAELASHKLAHEETKGKHAKLKEQQAVLETEKKSLLDKILVHEKALAEAKNAHEVTKTAHNEEIKKLTEDMVSIQKDLLSQKTELAFVMEELKLSKEKVTSLEKEADQASSDSKKKAEELRKAGDLLSAAQEAKEKLADDIMALNGKLEVAKRDAVCADSELQKKTEEYKETEAKLTEEKAALASEIETLRSSEKETIDQMKKLESELQKLKKELVKKDKEINDLGTFEEKLKASEASVSMLTGANKELVSKHKEVEEKLKTLGNSHSELQKQHKKAQENISKVTEVAEGHEKKHRELEKSIQEITKLHDAAEEKQKLLQADLDELKVRNRTLEEKVGVSERALESALKGSEDSAQMQQKLAESEKKALESVRQLEEAQKKVVSLEQEVSSLQKAVSGSKSADTEFKKALAALESDRDEARKAVTELEEQLSKKEKELEVERAQLDITKKAAAEQKKELEKTEAESAARNSSEKELRAEIERLQKKLAMLAKQAKSEADDLMLLMSDMDDKSRSYKARLRKLGEEVSSDEDNDDDDDDDE